MATALKPNDMNAATTKLCLALEEHRRTAAGHVRTSKEFLDALFPYDAARCEDRVFRHMPREVRGPIVGGVEDPRTESGSARRRRQGQVGRP